MVIMLNCDCVEYMKSCRDKEFDLAICDPPYGIGIMKQWGGARV
jgi:site-specific DNA-methyltransferase (adenine-specific)